MSSCAASAQFSAGHVPAHIDNGIAEARAEIAQIKAWLRTQGEAVEDLPGDLVLVSPAHIPAALPSEPPSTNTYGVTAAGSNNTVRQKQQGVDRAPASASVPAANGSPAALFGETYSDRQNRHTLIDDMRRRIDEQLATIPHTLELELVGHRGTLNLAAMRKRSPTVAQQRKSRTGQTDDLPSTDSHIIDLYSTHQGQLLILGAPGSGKSFLLHQLARGLIARAEQDEREPVPVIFSLASWQPDQAIADWLVVELSKRYGVRPAVMLRLFNANAIVPLFDGLDAISMLKRRRQCVEAINVYRQSQDRLSPLLVVACREREYQDLPTLKLSATLVIQPLAPAQIDQFLNEPIYIGLRQALERDPHLAEALHVPLLFGLVVATYRDRAPELPPDLDAEGLRRVAMRDYVVRCMASRADIQAPRLPPSVLHAFLAWLARGMAAHHQQEFYIEFLQPSWLPSRGWYRKWRVLSESAGMLLVGLLVGLCSLLLFMMFVGLLGGLGITLLLMLLVGSFVGLSGELNGAAIIQHYALRLLLAYSTPAPFLLVPWLEEACQRGLLVRVGGGYRFYHELLQRYFATYDDPAAPTVRTLAEIAATEATSNAATTPAPDSQEP